MIMIEGAFLIIFAFEHNVLHEYKFKKVELIVYI